MITAADPSDHGTDLSDHFDRNAQPERDLAFSGHFPQVSPERSGACADDVLAGGGRAIWAISPRGRNEGQRRVRDHAPGTQPSSARGPSAAPES